MSRPSFTDDAKREHSRAEVKKLIEVFGPTVMVDVIPSNMLAGPCEACRTIGDASFLPDHAPAFPLLDCTHPDQCACMVAIHSYDDGDGGRLVTGIAAGYRRRPHY